MRINFTKNAWDEYLWWQVHDKKTLLKINTLIKDICRNSYKGIGKPEALKGNLTGWYSRRIDSKNRIVYKIVENDIVIVQCKGHYQDK